MLLFILPQISIISTQKWLYVIAFQERLLYNIHISKTLEKGELNRVLMTEVPIRSHYH